MSKLNSRLNFKQVAKLIQAELDEVRALIVEERRLPAIYVTQVGYSEPYQYQLLRVDDEGRAFDMATGGIEGVVHTGFLRVERTELDKFILAEGLEIPLVDPKLALTLNTEFIQGATSPAPVEAVDALGETVKVEPVGEKWMMKKAALIKKHLHQWPTISRDFQDASENGLSKAAKAPGHGEWFEADCLNWAGQRGKLEMKKQQDPANLEAVWTGKKHIMKG